MKGIYLRKSAIVKTEKPNSLQIEMKGEMGKRELVEMEIEQPVYLIIKPMLYWLLVAI